MIKYYDYAITFSEFPDEIALCINITNCPNNCKNCSEPWLKEDIGEELTIDKIDSIIKLHPHITLFGFMGGDNDIDTIYSLSCYIKNRYNIKIGMYSGKDIFISKLFECLDYYKIGRWITPEGDPTTWHLRSCGPIVFPFSNQLMLKKLNNSWVNITHRFREKSLNDLSKYII